MTTYYHNQIKQQTLEIILIYDLCQLLVGSWRYVTKCEKWPLYSSSVKHCICGKNCWNAGLPMRVDKMAITAYIAASLVPRRWSRKK